MRRGDIWLIGILLTAALGYVVLFFVGDDTSEDGAVKIATITVDGEIVEAIELGQDQQQFLIETRHGMNWVEMKDGSVRMLEADCPDQLCVWSGAISKVNETIVCLPHRLIVEIVQYKGEGAEIDAVVR